MMLDVLEWSRLVDWMEAEVRRREVRYFYMLFTPDERAAAIEVLIDRLGGNPPPIYTPDFPRLARS